MSPDRPLLGILLMLGFCVLAPLGDSLAKILGGRVSLVDLVFLRFLAQAILILPIMAVTGRNFRMPARAWRLTALRTALHVAGVGTMFLALQFLPVADAIAIAFVMPFLLLALGRYVLDEAVGPHRLSACAVGFAGTLLVIQPNFAEVGAPALLPLGVAVFFALFILVTRHVARSIDAITLQGASGVLAVPVLVPFVLVDGTLLPPLAPVDWWLVAALGLTATVGHLLMTWSLRFAPAATLAPMQYLEIPVATVFGYVIFSDLPNGLAAAGIVVTVGAGLYIIARERQIGRAAKRPTMPAPHSEPPSEG